jgi:hypothetical protein
MVNLKKTELAETVEPDEGIYRIVAVEEVKTAVQGFTGIRISMKSDKNPDVNYATMLWTREVAGKSSKLGSFIYAFKEFFGDIEKAMDTDNWIGHTVRLISWAPKKREVKVLD